MIGSSFVVGILNKNTFATVMAPQETNAIAEIVSAAILLLTGMQLHGISSDGAYDSCDDHDACAVCYCVWRQEALIG